MSESYESNGPDNSGSPVNENGGDVVGLHNADSKDDLFVDASDDLDDARNADNRESVASNETETSNYEEKQDANRKENHFVENEYMFGDNQLLADELERLRDLLEKTTSERDSIEKNYKEERGSIARELATLRHQLKVLTNKELLLGENGGESRDASLRELMSEYSQFLTSALEERSRCESEIRELNAAQYKKDQEIEHLNAKVAELSVSHDVAATYLNSVAGVVSDAQLEKDQYVEVVTDRMLSYLAMVVYQDELLDNSICGKITNVEKSTYFLIETYNQMLYEIYQLGQCLSKTDPDLRVQEQFATVFAAARDELLELKRREVEMVEKVSHLEDENRKFVEQVEKDKQMVETVNAELSKTMTELEQEKMRCANSRDKLSMAVTKGKALVQQRDSLKRSLADKTRELEKCLAELQDKSSALQAAQLSKEEFIKSENLVAALQETLQQSDLILEKSQEVLSETDVPEELQSLDMVEKIKWLVNERNELKVVSLDFYKLKDAISSIDVPETISFPDLESRLDWLKDLFYQAKDDADVLLDQLDRTKEAARNEIDRLSASLSAELQEKDYIQKELEDLVCKYEDIVKKANKVSLEKDHMVKLLLDESGMTMEDQDVIYHTYSDMAMLIYKCTENIRAQSSASDTSGADSETIQRMQSLLYVRNQELMLCEQILEEETLARFQLNDLPNKLIMVSEELGSLKEEKDSLLKDLERSEEKSALLREKLSMAVKKGKGLVQDRENLKLQLDEKNSEIEKLKHNLQQLEFTVSECRDQINRLSNDLECIPKLEADLVAMKDQRNQFEQFLLESNNLLQKVIESVDRIVLPVDSVFEEPVEKVNWIAGYINDCQDTKVHLEQELGNVKQEAIALASKLAEAQETMRSLEDALLVAENKISQLADEKKEVEVSKKTVEQELEKEIEEARFQISKFSEACESRKSLEDELSVEENNMSVLITEKEEAQAGRAAAIIELEQVREEFASQTSKLTEAYKTIKSLEDSLSQVEANLALLIEQNNVKQVGQTTLENELQKLKDEAESQALKLADAYTTIKSLEDALLKADNDISVLQSEKKIADQEVLTLNSKLNGCMEELAGTRGSLESRSVELAGHLNDLHMLMKDERLLSTAKQCFEREIEGLQNLDLIIEDIRDWVVGKGSATLEGNSHASKSFANDLDNIQFDCGEMTGADADKISSCFRKIVEGFEMRNTILTDKFEHFFTSIDEFIATLLRKLQITRDEVVRMTQSMEFLEQKVGNLEVYKREQEEAMVALQNDVTILLSVCSDATRELQFEVKNNLLELKSVPELEKLNHTFFQEEREAGGDDPTEHQKSLEGNKYVEIAEKLLFSVRKAQTMVKFFDVTSNIAASTIQDLQKKLQEATTTFEKTIDERDLHQNKVSKLEADVVALEYSCRELSLKAEDYQAKEKKLKEREAEISLLYDRLSMKEQVTEAEDFLLSLSQMRTLVEKINGIEIPHAESVGDVEPESSAEVKKLFSIINSVTELQHQINLSEQEKQELQLTISTQTAEIEYLKGEVETHIRNKPDLEKMKLEFSEFTFGLEKIVNMLGSNEIIVNQKFGSPQGVLTMLEKQIMTLRSEAENSKSKIQELDSKLLGSQKVVDELTRKVNLPEETLHGSAVQPEIVQERSVFEEPSLPSGSEISEVEDAGMLGQKTISPVSSAAHVRTMRKGSTDHLAINIDSESARLINNEETDEDKGHVFKSLNTSGLIPKQGKMIADRIDGIWVSGGRVLMSRPRARLGLIAYCLFLHMWLLGTIL